MQPEDLRTTTKTTTTASAGRVQLNFLTAERDQHWKSIFCSDTRLASIIQRCVLLGDLTLSHSHIPSSGETTLPPPPPPPPLLMNFSKIIWHIKFELAALAHPRLSAGISAGSGEMAYNLSDVLKRPRVVSVAIYLSPTTHSDPSPPPAHPVFTHLLNFVRVKKHVPVIPRLLSHPLLLPSHP